MRKSVLSVLAVAALATSAIALDAAAARDLGGGGAPGPSPGAGSLATPGGGGGPSGGQSSGRSMGTMNASPSFQNNSQWNGRNSSGRQWSGGNYDRHGSHHRHRHGNVAFGFYDGGYYNDYAYDADCYRLHRVHTRSGWHWRRIYVCD